MPTNPIPRSALERNIEAAEQAMELLEHEPDDDIALGHDVLLHALDPVSGLAALSRRVIELEDGIADALDTLTMPMPAYPEPSGDERVKLADWTGRRDLVRDALKALLAHAPTQETT